MRALSTLSWGMAVVAGLLLAAVLLVASLLFGKGASWIGPIPSIPAIIIFVVFMIVVATIAYGMRVGAA